MFTKALRIIALAIVAALAVVLCGSAAQVEPTSLVKAKLVVFHAGSLAVPFREITALFNAAYPNVVVEAEAAGSRDTARKVSDLGRPGDVIGVADYLVLDDLFVPQFADYNIRFAANEMAIAFTSKSRQAAEINAKNWPEVLLRSDVAFGRADPNRDPCGYRTEMVFQLAEKYYATPGLASQLKDKHGSKYIRPKETDLLGLLEAGEIDYLFIYRSVCMQHELEYLILPDEINLKTAKYAALYDTAAVQVTGDKPGEFVTYRGTPMVYGVTIPKNSEQPELALAYISLLLSPAGQEVMKRNGQPSIAPALCVQYDKLPADLKPLCVKVE